MRMVTTSLSSGSVDMMNMARHFVAGSIQVPTKFLYHNEIEIVIILKIGNISRQLGRPATRENVLQTGRLQRPKVLILCALVKDSCGH